MAKATDTDMAEVIGNNLRAARMRAGLTLEHVAEVVGVEPVTVSRWESGTRSPSVSVLARLAQITGVDPGSLLAVGGDPTPQVPEDVAEVLELMGQMDGARRRTALRVLQALAEEG